MGFGEGRGKYCRCRPARRSCRARGRSGRRFLVRLDWRLRRRRAHCLCRRRQWRGLILGAGIALLAGRRNGCSLGRRRPQVGCPPIHRSAISGVRGVVKRKRGDIRRRCRRYEPTQRRSRRGISSSVGGSWGFHLCIFSSWDSRHRSRYLQVSCALLEVDANATYNTRRGRDSTGGGGGGLCPNGGGLFPGLPRPMCRLRKL
jgi:hypothetical protein